VVWATALLAAAPAGALLRAEQITPASAAELLIGGPDAIGGVGDWYLANDVVEVVVDDPARKHAKLEHGGTLVDVGLRDRTGEDQFARLIPIANLSQRVQLGYDAIRAELDSADGRARLVVTGRPRAVPRGDALTRWLDPMVPRAGSLAEVRVETVYEVAPGEPFVRITTTLHNDGDTRAPLFAFGDLWMRGGRSMRSFVGNALFPERARGFHHRTFQRTNLLASMDAMASSTHVSVPGARSFPPIAYALFAPERAARGETQFGITGEHVDLTFVFTGGGDWQELSLLRFLWATRGGIPANDSFTYRRRLLVAGRPDAASTTDVILPLLGAFDGRSGIAGSVRPAHVPASIQVDDAEGHPVTQIATAGPGPDAGRFGARLPPGDYRLTVRSPQRPSRALRVTVRADRTLEIPPLRLEATGTLVFAPAFADAGPGRVVVSGRAGTADPVFGDELLDFRLDGARAPSGTETNALHFIGNDRDPESISVPPGRYTLTATRGFEYDAARVEVDVPGPDVRIVVPPFDLARVATLEGFVSADLHVHAQASDDSSTRNDTRLRHFVAASVDVMVASDHDHVPDYAAAVRELDVEDRILVIRGVEVTSSAPGPRMPWTIGHHNGWPVPYLPLRHRKGAPPSQDLSVAELYALLRNEHAVEVVQLNHPRGELPGLDEEGFLTHLGVAGRGFDPGLPLDRDPNRPLLAPAADGTRAIDFDAMEVMNGAVRRRYLAARRDWYALLRQGFRRTGTANSDTHGPDQPAGVPRNYVYVGPAGRRLDAAALDAALREGRAFGTNGPLVVHFAVNGRRMGDLAAAEAGRVRVEFDVVAAPWVPLDEVRLVVNGEVVRVFGRSFGLAELSLERDAFVTLEAGAPLAADPHTWIARHRGPYTDAIAPGFLPAAFTNPVYVDVDGNGRFDPPGLPPRLPRPTSSGPLAATAALLAVVLLLARGRGAARARSRAAGSPSDGAP
jgi:hypothetical protein